MAKLSEITARDVKRAASEESARMLCSYYVFIDIARKMQRSEIADLQFTPHVHINAPQLERHSM